MATTPAAAYGPRGYFWLSAHLLSSASELANIPKARANASTHKKHMPMPTYGQQTQNPVSDRRMVVSEVDKGGLWHLVLEQHPERIWMGLAIPGFELVERVENIGKRRTVLSSGCQTCKDLLHDGHEV